MFGDCALTAHVHVWPGLLVLLVLLLYDLHLRHLESLLLVLLIGFLCHLSCLCCLSLLLWDVKYLKKCEVIQPFQIDTFQNYLRYDKLNVFFFELNFSEKLSQIFLRNCPFTVFPVRHCCQYLLVVWCDKFSDLQKHFFFLDLGQQLKWSDEFFIVLEQGLFGDFRVFINLDLRCALFNLFTVANLQQEDLNVAFIQDNKGLSDNNLQKLFQGDLLFELFFSDILSVEQILLRLSQTKMMSLESKFNKASQCFDLLLFGSFDWLCWNY